MLSKPTQIQQAHTHTHRERQRERERGGIKEIERKGRFSNGHSFTCKIEYYQQLKIPISGSKTLLASGFKIIQSD